jgi:capsular polysaccharide biosynthesis protein
MRGDKHFRTAVAWIHGKLQHLMVGTSHAQDRLFVSRSDAAHRFLVNEEELFSALSVLGFQRIVPGRMTVREQIEAFSRAKVIVAPHGAALTNIIFSPPGLHLIEISSTNKLHMADFRWIAQMMKHRITTIVSDDYLMDEQQKAKVTEVDWDYRVSVSEVVKAIRSQP